MASANDVRGHGDFLFKVEVAATPTALSDQVSVEETVDSIYTDVESTGETAWVTSKFRKAFVNLTVSALFPAAGDAALDVLKTAAHAATDAARQVEASTVLDATTDETASGTASVRTLTKAEEVTSLYSERYALRSEGAWAES